MSSLIRSIGNLLVFRFLIAGFRLATDRKQNMVDLGASCKRVKRSKTTDHMIGEIHDELLIKVLCCLPPKNLIRCSCVCKGWFELIDRYCLPQITPFLGCHIRIKTSSAKVVVVGRASIPYVRADVDAWPPVFNTHNPIVGTQGYLNKFCPSPKHLLDSCNGLMLFIHNYGNMYVLWNPNTKQFLFIACPKDKHRVFAALAVEPTWNLDKKGDFFKIITFPEDKGTVDVLSSRDCTLWVERKVKYNRPINNDTFTKAQSFFKRFVYLHGRLFILCQPRLLLWYTIRDDDVDVICDYVKLPHRDHSGTRDGRREGCIGSCGGRLQFAQNDEALRLVQIWVLSVDTREWIFMHGVSLEALVKYPQLLDLRTMFPAVKVKFKLLAFDPVSDDGVIIWTQNLIFCYYYKSGHLVSLQCPDILNDALKHRPFDAFPFTQCLNPLVFSGSQCRMITKAWLPDGSMITVI